MDFIQQVNGVISFSLRYDCHWYDDETRKEDDEYVQLVFFFQEETWHRQVYGLAQKRSFRITILNPILILFIISETFMGPYNIQPLLLSLYSFLISHISPLHFIWMPLPRQLLVCFLDQRRIEALSHHFGRFEAQRSIRIPIRSLYLFIHLNE